MFAVRIFILSRRRLALGILSFIAICAFLVVSQRVFTAPSLAHMAGTYYMSRTQEKVVALTFDDGPDPIDTPAVLDILKEEDVPATFFVLGEAAHLYPDLIKRIVQEGHEIGNHGYSHDYQQRRLTEELRKTDQEVFAATGTHTQFYRPPGGFLSPSQLEVIRKNGHIAALWSVDSKDWRNPGVQQIVNNVLDTVSPGAVILLHDGGYQRVQTVKAVTPIIKALREQGYRFTTLSDLKQLDADG